MEECFPYSLPETDEDRPVLLVVVHGILTGKTDASWAPDFAKWYGNVSPVPVRSVVTDYFEWPLPRFAALRNVFRVLFLFNQVVALIESMIAEFGRVPVIKIVTHSNGAVLGEGLMRKLFGNGCAIRVHSFTAMAPATRTGQSSRLISQWIDEGWLGLCHLVRARKDGVLSFASRYRLVVWPWGALGWEGWDLDEVAEGSLGAMPTTDLPAEHSGFLDVAHRLETFETVIGPLLGISTNR